MNIKNIFTISAIINFIYAIGFLIIPGQINVWFGAEPNEASIFMGRYFGGAILAIGVMLWLARNSGKSDARTGILAGSLLYGIAAFFISIWIVISGQVNALGWTTVVLTFIISLALAILFYTNPD